MNKLRILIADDHEVFRRGLRSLVEERPEWSVCGEATAGADTLEKTRTLCPDLVLLDVSMPDAEATKAIPEIMHLCPTVKIVALATQDSAELAASAIAAGAIGLVLKTEEAAELVRTVQTIGEGRPFLSAGAVTMIRSRLAARPRPAEALPADLTPREVEVLGSLAKGRSNKEIAATLGVSVKTVNAHRANIMRTLNLRTYSALIHFAIRNGMVEI